MVQFLCLRLEPPSRGVEPPSIIIVIIIIITTIITIIIPTVIIRGASQQALGCSGGLATPLHAAEEFVRCTVARHC